VELSVAAEGGRVVLRVADTGPGLSADVKAQMFSPFFTTKAPGEGTGLGLFVSYGIAEAHGGTLTAESPPGQGATLILVLPVAAEAAPPTRAAAPPATARKILVVDDDPAMRRVVAALFSRDGHRVDAAATGADALRLAAAERYDLIIADRFASADGVPLTAALARLPGGDASRRLILSTSETRAGGEARSPAQVPRMLRKPFDLRDLKKAAEEVFGRSD
jgi:CheY-like chemotaxis protein